MLLDSLAFTFFCSSLATHGLPWRALYDIFDHVGVCLGNGNLNVSAHSCIAIAAFSMSYYTICINSIKLYCLINNNFICWKMLYIFSKQTCKQARKINSIFLVPLIVDKLISSWCLFFSWCRLQAMCISWKINNTANFGNNPIIVCSL